MLSLKASKVQTEEVNPEVVAKLLTVEQVLTTHKLLIDNRWPAEESLEAYRGKP